MQRNNRRKLYCFIKLTCSGFMVTLIGSLCLTTEYDWTTVSQSCHGIGRTLQLPGFVIKARNYLLTKPYDLEIICMVFNRTKSLERLLNSLNMADYEEDKILLSVWLDRNKTGHFDNKTYEAAERFVFKHGDYKVNVHKKHVGLYGQWLTTYDFKHNSHKADIVVFFEDDITVSPFFYKYLKMVHSKYDSQSDVNGYSLHGNPIKHAKGSDGTLHCPKEHPVFKYPTLGTWGFSPNLPHWKRFLTWYNKAHRIQTFHPYVPSHKSTAWYKDHEKNNITDRMWSIWHIYYAWSHNEYTIYCNFPDDEGLTTNWEEEGLHYTGTAPEMSNPLLTNWTLTCDMLPDHPVTLNNAGNIVKQTER